MSAQSVGKELSRELNQRQMAFARMVVCGMNQTEAYLSAGYRPKKRATAETGASILAHKPYMVRYISRLREQHFASQVMSLSEKRAFLAEVKRTPIGVLGAESPLTKKARYRTISRKNPDTGEIETERVLEEIEGHDKLKAIELDAKLAGELDGDSAQVNIALQLVNQRAEERAKALPAQASWEEFEPVV